MGSEERLARLFVLAAVETLRFAHKGGSRTSERVPGTRFGHQQRAAGIALEVLCVLRHDAHEEDRRAFGQAIGYERAVGVPLGR